MDAGHPARGPDRGAPEPFKSAKDMPPVTMPRTWLTATEALAAAHRQRGLLYAVLPADFDGVVGPFAMSQQVPLVAFLDQVAAATRTRWFPYRGAAVFEGPTAGMTEEQVKAALAKLDSALKLERPRAEGQGPRAEGNADGTKAVPSTLDPRALSLP